MYNLQFIWLPSTHSIINFTDPFLHIHTAYDNTEGRWENHVPSCPMAEPVQCITWHPRRQLCHWALLGLSTFLPPYPSPTALPFPMHRQPRVGIALGGALQHPVPSHWSSPICPSNITPSGHWTETWGWENTCCWGVHLHGSVVFPFVGESAQLSERLK